jgi:dipeptidyl aminopeptidase/acylaminoacyl peptidase
MRLPILFLSLLACLSLWGQPSTPTRLAPLDIFGLRYAVDPQISPDGSRIVYERHSLDIMSDQRYSNLWLVRYDGTDHRPLTQGDQRDREARWSPDGKQIAYLSDQDGSTQIYLLWVETGTRSQLTRLTESPSGLQWSPDGKWLSFSMRVPAPAAKLVDLPPKPAGATWAEAPVYIEDLTFRDDGSGYRKPGHQQLFIMPAEGGLPRQLSRGPYHHEEDYCWTPDSRRVIVSANRHPDAARNPNDTELYAFDLEGGPPRQLTDRRGPDHHPRVSPDGRSLAYLGYDEQYLGYQADVPYLMDLTKDRLRPLPLELDRSIDQIEWSGGGEGLFLRYDSQGNTKLAYLTLEGKLSGLADYLGGTTLGRPYGSGSFSVSANDRFAFPQTGPHQPAEVAVGTRIDPDIGRLTYLNQGLLDVKKLGEVEEIWVNSSYDGTRIQGWLVKPPNFDPSRRYPLLLEIHGGPFANYGDRFSAEMQLYAAAGYVVLYLNPRGSTGYGAEFANLIHHNYPGEDYFDLMSAVDVMVEKPYIDAEQLYITGGSGGGTLTAWCIGQTDRFRAAVVAKPVINWYSFVLYADHPAFFYQYWFPGLPWEHLAHYFKRSPISLVDRVNTPTMLLTGEKDYRTPIAESEQYYAALKLRGVEAAMVRLPEASHNIAAKPSYLIAKVSYILGWFDKYRGIR